MGLEIEAVRIVRGGRLVVAGASLSVARGEAVLLRGPNGAGKSSLIRAVAGLVPVAGGRILLDGADLARERDRAADAVAYAGHLDAVKPQLTVAENLAVWAGLFGGDAGAALEGFGLEGIADRLAGLCSAGQKRRLGLARLLLAERPLWLLDEPTVSLDAAAAERVAGAVRAHCGRGGMALIATHVDLGLPQARVALLDPPGEVARAEADPFLSGDWT